MLFAEPPVALAIGNLAALHGGCTMPARSGSLASGAPGCIMARSCAAQPASPGCLVPPCSDPQAVPLPGCGCRPLS
eukprot:11208815-Lingulodinium_polyedra.AAC.1